MGAIANELHELWHEVDREPMDVVFDVRFKGNDKTIRSVLVTHSTTYQLLAFYPKRVKAEVDESVKDQLRSGEHLLATKYSLDTLRSSEVERKLEIDHAFNGTGVPDLYNPVHYVFSTYAEHWINGHLVLVRQAGGFYRYCVVPKHLVDRTSRSGITVLAF